jgi:ElaB/YqjD/DUF883 family membrane-anchored ribosome-binding protein
MNRELVQKASAAAADFVHLTHEGSKARFLVEDVIEDGRLKAQRLIKRSRMRAEDYVDDTTYFIKHHPWQSVGVALGLGAGAGVLLGWVFSRNFDGCKTTTETDENLGNFHSGE